jgi:hypothetical protein
MAVAIFSILAIFCWRASGFGAAIAAIAAIAAGNEAIAAISTVASFAAAIDAVATISAMTAVIAEQGIVIAFGPVTTVSTVATIGSAIATATGIAAIARGLTTVSTSATAPISKTVTTLGAIGRCSGGCAECAFRSIARPTVVAVWVSWSATSAERITGRIGVVGLRVKLPTYKVKRQ